MQQFFYIAWMIVQCITALFLLFPLLSWLLYLVFGRKPLQKAAASEIDMAIIVTAYKNSSNLPNVIQSLLKLNYSNYMIYVVADNCEPFDPGTTDPKVNILYPPTLLENQVKSHFYAVQQFKRSHEALTIIDSDNLVDPNYLTEINNFFAQGYEAVQGVRTAKNLDTAYACLDAANEVYYLFYDRIILFGLGSSSMLTGSGMAFTVSLYKTCLETLNTSGAGFDKVLQYQLLKRGKRIAFAEKAIVYDEKTSKADQLVKQRARWNNTWFRYFKYGFRLMGLGIRNASLNQLLYGFVLLRPPTFLILLFSGMLMLANLFICIPFALAWAISLVLFTLAFLLALKILKADKRIFAALGHIPKFIFFQVLSLLKVRKANQFSVATEHHYNKEIEEIKE